MLHTKRANQIHDLEAKKRENGEGEMVATIQIMFNSVCDMQQQI